MDLLRWILLVVGILVVIGVYVWSRRREQVHEDMFIRTEPGVGHDDETVDPLFAPTPRAMAMPPLTTDDGEPDLEAVHRELSTLQDLLKVENAEAVPAMLRSKADKPAVRKPVPTASTTHTAPAAVPLPPEEKLVVLYLVAHPNQVFTASAIAESLRDLDLEYGDMHIYHRYPDDPRNDAGNNAPVFGVANLVEPGTLEPEVLAETGTPGLTLFLQLPGPLRPVQAFDLFVSTAQQLTTRLDGELRDKNRNVLSQQMLDHLRDDIQQYERRLRLPAHA
jgi:cell division protein ZipA